MVCRGVRLYALNHSSLALIHAFSYLMRRLRGQVSPVSALIATTYKCQCRCPHCYAYDNNRPEFRELTTKEMFSLLDQLKGIGTLQVIFTGGEPLLRPDIFELIAYAHNIGLLTRINTNACCLDSDCASKLKKAGLNQCGISIDFVEAELHDRFRSLPGLHATALQALGNLREKGIQRVMYVSVTHEKLAAGLERFVELGKALKVNSCFFSIPYAAGRWEESYDQVLSEEEMAALCRLQRFSSVATEFYSLQTNCCAYNKALLSISANGDVSPCSVVPFPVGNIRNEPLSAIWARQVSAARLESSGKCPMNSPEGRAQMKAYCETVGAKGPARN